MDRMEDWRTEFQYLLNRKMLSRDELAYLFGQIKSIVERSINSYIYNLVAKLTNNKYGPPDPPRKGFSEPQWSKALQEYIGQLEAEITELKEKAKGRDELINKWHGKAKELEGANRWIPVNERLPRDQQEEVLWYRAGFPVRWEDSEFYYESSAGYTHWKPITLPEPESETKESKENAEN